MQGTDLMLGWVSVSSIDNSSTVHMTDRYSAIGHIMPDIDKQQDFFNMAGAELQLPKTTIPISQIFTAKVFTDNDTYVLPGTMWSEATTTYTATATKVVLCFICLCILAIAHW